MTGIRTPTGAVRGRRALRAAIAFGLAALTAAALPAVADAQQNRQPPNLNVLSRNLYLGADLVPALLAPDQATLFQEAGKVWRHRQETNFTARAKVLADEIARHNVDVIGLQEAALWRRDTTGAPDGPATPAREVVQNFVFLLRSELRDRGLRYWVASRQQAADLEVPLDFGSGPVYDGRLTMFDAILVKRSPRLRVVNSRSGTYQAGLPLELPGFPPGTVPRAWTSVDMVKIKGPWRNPIRSHFRVVNTHLEAFSAFVRASQAGELTAGTVLRGRKPIIVLGDLNSDPADPTSSTSPPDPVPTPNAQAYNLLRNAGFVDRGVGFNTCCHDDDLLNAPPAAFTSRIDHILTRPGLVRRAGRLLGANPTMRTPTGLWPSDHGGVFSRLRLRR